MRLKALHHVHFAVTDLSETERFAHDFGLHTVSKTEDRIYLRTAGGDAFCYVAERSDRRGFKGLAFTVEDYSDLEKAVCLPGAGPIKNLEGPSQGNVVTLDGPEGLRVELVHGLRTEEPAGENPSLLLNAPGAYQRFNAAQSFRNLEPAKIYRLGHIGLYVQSYSEVAAWLQETLGLRLSDAMHNGDPKQRIVGFFRLDHGSQCVDHHTVFIAQFGKTDCHHISFEVQDYEAQFMAHRWLLSRGWRPNWGVGRHPLGSHVFDVWFDPDGYRFETFSDTDLVNDGHVAGSHDVHGAQMDLWSSDSPERYFA